MQNPSYPQNGTSTTEDTTTKLEYNGHYLRTRAGLLKVAQIVLNFVGFFSVQFGSSISVFASNTRKIYEFVSLTAFFLTGILLVMYLYQCVKKWSNIPWMKIEMVYCGVWTFLYFIVSSMCMTIAVEAFRVAGVFGFINVIIYGADAYIKYGGVRNRESPQ